MNRSTVYLALVVVQILFGLLPVAGALAMREISPPALTAFRLYLGAPVLYLIVRLMKRGHPRLSDMPRLAVLAALGVAANQLLFAEGLVRAGPINSVVLICIIPVITLLFAMTLGLEKPARLRIVGIFAALAGVLVVVRVERFDLSDAKLVGDLFILANATSYSMYLVLTRPMLQRMGPLVLVTWVFILGAIEATPWTLGPFLSTPWTTLSMSTQLALAFILIGPTIGTYFLNAVALRQVDSSLVAVFISLQPLIGSLGAYLVFGEAITLRVAFAALLILGGVVLATRPVREA